MTTVSLFEPRHPLSASTVIEQLHIDAFRIYVWRLLISPEDSIVRERMMFGIRLPDIPHTIYAQLGVVVMRDHDHTVYTLLTNHAGSPPLIMITNSPTNNPHNLTWLIRTTYNVELNMTIMYLG